MLLFGKCLSLNLTIRYKPLCSRYVRGVRRIFRVPDYQYRLRPKRHQYPRLEAILEGQRLLYNAALEERSQAWGKSHWSVTRIDQTKSLTIIRAFDPQGYGALPVTLSRWSLNKVDEAFQDFFG